MTLQIFWPKPGKGRREGGMGGRGREGGSRAKPGNQLVYIYIYIMGNSSVTHFTFFQFFYFHWATIKHLVDQSNKFKAYDDLGVQLYITT